MILLALAIFPIASRTQGTIEATSEWLSRSSIRQGNEVAWFADPTDRGSITTSLYTGTPGPILFYLEFFRQTGERKYLETARQGADGLLSKIRVLDGQNSSSLSASSTSGSSALYRDNDPGLSHSGLYVGLSGIGYTLGEAYRVTGDLRYLEGARTVVRLLAKRAVAVKGDGVEWNKYLDITDGGSGIGLFLLWADQKLGIREAKGLAVKAANHLLNVAIKDDASKGLKWIRPAATREWPNFSHGTAGVAYFLATLYARTKEDRFLEAALLGTKYLLSIADSTAKYCLIRHINDEEGRQRFYLSWCHGPPGTARLFYRLYLVTKERKWLDWLKRSAAGITKQGGPEKVVTPGDWDNVSVCCGVAGQARFFLDMFRVTKEKRYKRLADVATARLLKKATVDSNGARWIQAENRTRQGEKVAQTGYMQGASGIGIWLLQLKAFNRRSAKARIVLPDDPF